MKFKEEKLLHASKKNKMLQQMSKIGSTDFSDLKIEVDGEIILAHKLVLSGKILTKS